MTRLAVAIATTCGLGYAPIAPGTFGSLAGVLLWWLLPATPLAQGLAIVAVFSVGTWSASIAERHFARTDPGPVVIDEVLGMLVTFFMVPVTSGGAVVAFLLFRAADIVKPYPANRFERLHGGLGIMADDGMAGVYANVALRIAVHFSGHYLG